MKRPELTIRQILAWADNYYSISKRWPRRNDGRIAGSLGETWQAVEMALQRCGRGLSFRSSLAKLLEERRAARNHNHLPRLSIQQIIHWADDHFAKKKVWPSSNSGLVLASPHEKWSRIDQSLKKGYRGLPISGSLAEILAKNRQVRRPYHLRNITKYQIMRWAMAYHRRHGHWPMRNSGAIPEAQGETWGRINTALVQGNRGFPKGGSLAQLLAQYGKQRNRKALPKLRIKAILRWADEFIQRTGRCPTHLSGPIPRSKGETWSAVHSALSQGGRGFPGGSSLFRLLKKHGLISQ